MSPRISMLAVALCLAGTMPALAQEDAIILFYRPESVAAPVGPGGGAGKETAVESGSGVGKVVRGVRKLLNANEVGGSDQNPTIYAISNGGNRKLATIAKGEFFTLPVRAGIHSFSWTGAPARGQTTILNVSSGQKVFIEVQFRSFTQITTDINLQALHPINVTRVFDSTVRIPVEAVQPAQTATTTTNAPGQQPQPGPQQQALADRQPATPQPAPAVQPVSAQNNDPLKTLGSIREKYLNQLILVGGSVSAATLLEWNPARKDGDRYRNEIQRRLAAKYRGLTAKVIAVKISDTTLSNDDAVDLVVQFSDGTLAMTSSPVRLLSSRVKLASEQAEREEEMARNLPLVMGKSLYATGFSMLYEPDTTLEEITGPKEVLKRVSVARIPVFEPLQIVTAKYVPGEDGVVFKVKLPNGREAIAFTKYSDLEITSSDAPFIQKISGSLLAAIPKELTSDEVAAIKRGDIFRGMSNFAVFYAFGPAERENDWGNGGKQRIYLKTISVYFDNQNNVVEWRGLDKK